MSDDLKTAISAIAKLHQNMEAIYRLANPSCLGVIEKLERTMEPLRRQLSIREDLFFKTVGLLLPVVDRHLCAKCASPTQCQLQLNV